MTPWLNLTLMTQRSIAAVADVGYSCFLLSKYITDLQYDVVAQ